ncbi:MAG: hypothetical protein ACI92W_001106 [Paraglaciecola sp.]|jgi:hypothetical protein
MNNITKALYTLSLLVSIISLLVLATIGFMKVKANMTGVESSISDGYFYTALVLCIASVGGFLLLRGYSLRNK